MYRVLIVDDERPALTYLNAIVTKHLPDFEVAGMAEDAQSALDLLKAQTVDVLITDVSMPGGMNGIDLAKAVREKYPAMHIVIVSGYAEFEYARGAMQAGVEDYLLKPISISRVKEVLTSVKTSLDEAHIPMLQQVLTQLLHQQEVKPDELARAFGAEPFHFAFARIGNLNSNRHARMTTIGIKDLTHAPWMIFYGRDESELLLLLPDAGLDGRFSDHLTDAMEHLSHGRPWTAIYAQTSSLPKLLPSFLDKANKLMNASLVMGTTQCLCVTAPAPADAGLLPVNIRRQLSTCIMNSSWRIIQEMFLSLAVEWEQAKIPQAQVEQLCYQLVNQTASEGGVTKRSQQAIREEVDTLYTDAGSVGELLSSLYGVLFGDLSIHDKQIGGDELCAFTLNYIKENYSLPLNIQSICAKTGFSQTYLSRLLRKYADTSVNTYLTQCRMEAAKKLLKESPSMLLRDVATMVGYEDQSYFNKIFRSETGMTPRQYAAQFAEK